MVPGLMVHVLPVETVLLVIGLKELIELLSSHLNLVKTGTTGKTVKIVLSTNLVAISSQGKGLFTSLFLSL